MDRMGCVDLPALPLQLLLKRHADWRGLPVAVIDHDKPLGIILWVNEAARTFRILPGMRYSAGLSLSGELRAGVVDEAEIEAAVERITRRLLVFSPRVEASDQEPGVFWIDATGILPLYASFAVWGACIQDDAGFRARVVVGFTRFGSYAAAWSRASGPLRSKSPHVFESREQEIACSRAVALEHLGLGPKLRDRLHRLGIVNLGGFLDLPGAGVLRRFGKEAHELHRLARGECVVPLDPETPREPARGSVFLDHPVKDLDRILAHIEVLL